MVEKLGGEAGSRAAEVLEAARQIAVLTDQRAFLTEYARRLVEEIVGVQLASHQISFEQAAAKVDGETRAANARLAAIEARRQNRHPIQPSTEENDHAQ